MEAEAHWLTRRRMVSYARICVVVFFMGMVAWVAASKKRVDPMGKPLGYDFITYWAAGKMAWAGRAAEAYSVPAIARVEHGVVPGSDAVFAWYYPPAFFLVAMPLALMPYLLGFGVFGAGTLAGYVAVFRRVARGGEAMWCLAGFSGVWLNFAQGQNGFLTGALAAGAVLALEDAPVGAGVLIGLLAVKPHLALLFPVVLIAVRAWKTLVVSMVTAVVMTGAGVAVAGAGTLTACVGSLGTARRLLEDGSLPWAKMPTVFASLRLLGVPVAGAYAVHGVMAAAAAWAVWRVWRESKDTGMRGAALMTGTFLMSPYVFDYDLAWMAFPIAWMGVAGLRDGWKKGEREVLAAAWLLPFCMAPLGTTLRVQPGAVVMMAMLWCVVRRVAETEAEMCEIDVYLGAGEAVFV